MTDHIEKAMYFNPRSPCGERRSPCFFWPMARKFQSTLPLRGATCSCFPLRVVTEISIHAPLAGSDARGPPKKSVDIFQSTLPLRGATAQHDLRRPCHRISIHAPLAGSDWFLTIFYLLPTNFNPRSPCGERRAGNGGRADARGFQSTLPLRGATLFTVRDCGARLISIHAPLAGSDLCTTQMMMRCLDFNPRSPCGERQNALEWRGERCLFQSTLPLRGATSRKNESAGRHHISIHAPLAGSDVSPFSSVTGCLYFNPRSPCGERLVLFVLFAP